MNSVKSKGQSKIVDLPTPCLLLDKRRLLDNIERVVRQSEELGIPLRPHVKTPKSTEIGKLLMSRCARGITVSTLREAEAFADEGFDDQLYATAIAPRKIERVQQLLKRGIRVRCVIDSLSGALEVAQSASEGTIPLPVLIEINVDDYRSGVRPDSSEFHKILQLLSATSSVSLDGLMSYAGASYHSAPKKWRPLAKLHRDALVESAQFLNDQVSSSPVLSFGSTPAFMACDELDGVSELRGGIFVFQDLFQAGIGACRLDDIALSVATTVISQQRTKNRVFVDAGGLALSKDRSTAGFDFDAGFGLIADSSGATIGDLIVRAVHQELGEVTSKSGMALDFDALMVGRVLRIFPNHADMTAAAYDRYFVVEGQCVVDVWGRFNGW